MEIFKHSHFSFYLLLSTIILLIGCGIGLLLTPPSVPHFILNGGETVTITLFSRVYQIFIHNLIATFIMISLGVITFKFIPIMCLLFNGYNIGNWISQLNYNASLIFATMFPHGYIEFPILLFSSMCSFIIIEEIQKTGLNGYTLLTKHKNPKVRYILKNYLLYPYIIIIIPGVFVAAIIEATFSLWNLRILVGI